MGIMDTTVKGGPVITFDLGLSKGGNTVFRISWFNGERWSYLHYSNFKEAFATYKTIIEMV